MYQSFSFTESCIKVFFYTNHVSKFFFTKQNDIFIQIDKLHQIQLHIQHSLKT
jgi:hypothetical protein